MANPKRESKSLTVRLSPQTGVKKTDNLHAFVVNGEGKVMAAIPFSGEEAVISEKHLPGDGSQKIYLAPGLPDQIRLSDLTERDLQKANAYHPLGSFTDQSFIEVNHIPAIALQPWFQDWCLVKGNVHKKFLIDGAWKDLPLCKMRVHVCEVHNKLWLPRIPVHFQHVPFWVTIELVDKIRQIQNELNPAVSRNAAYVSANPAAMQRNLNMGNMTMHTQMAKQNLVPLPEHVMSALNTSSMNELNEAISQHYEFIEPYICYWPAYWPWFYDLEENPSDVVYTDCDGNFELWKHCLGAACQFDIYIWIEACINGTWQTVYHPSLPCHTWWNYPCNTNIDITITDPRVMPCSCDEQVHGEIVWFKSIGWHASALHIEQNDANLVTVANGAYSAAMKNVGCTDIIDSHRISPFGATLGFRMLFGDGLPTTNITHYRWNKTMIKDANLNPVAFPVTSVVSGEIRKTYYVITAANNFETHSVILGAEGSGENIGYRIPHWNIYDDPGVPAADKLLALQWTAADFFGAWIDTKSLTDGLFRFDLELLSKDASGNFHVEQVPKSVFQVSTDNNSTTSQDAPADYLKLAGSNAINFTIKLRIDNASCHADIQDVALVDAAGNPVIDPHTLQPVKSGKCGFIKYTDLSQKARISFEASQPRNFATFDFNVVKGNGTESTGVAASGYVITSAGNFILSGGIFTQDVPITQLLGTCPGQAAFAENLEVYPLAVDGTFRLDFLHSGYRDDDTNAFALTN